MYALVRPLLFAIEAERAHRWAVAALARLPGAAPRADDPILASRVWGIDFPNPVGLAAGFDKHGEALHALPRLGFGFAEFGSVTPLPQPGNPRPRVFRLREDRAVVNRYGFNSVGAAGFATAYRASTARAGAARLPAGINLGKNKDTPAERAADDFAAGAAALGGLGDYLVVNVSSPNTPGLRALQGKDELVKIARAVRNAVAADAPPPLLLKIAPDLAEADLADIAAVAGEGLFDGVIVSNTTTARPDSLRSARRREGGGLSGAPLAPLALAALRRMHALTAGRVPLVGVGGIASGADTYARIRAGAALVQVYTALVYEGPGLIARIKRDLAALLRRDGFARVADAVGADARGDRGRA